LTIARTLGSQLEVLDLTNQPTGTTEEQARLRELVVGEVLFGIAPSAPAPLFPDFGDVEPWLGV
jgi:hypothetical protein